MTITPARVRRALAAGLLALAPITLVVVWQVVDQDLPRTLATHWGLDGRPDGFTGAAPFVAGVVAATGLVALGGLAALGLLVARMPARALTALFASVAWLLASAGSTTLLAARGVADPEDVRSGLTTMALCLLVTVVAGALGWWLTPEESAPAGSRLAPSDAPYHLREGERAVWIGSARSRTLLLAAALSVVVSAPLLVLGNWWAVALLVTAGLLAWTHSLTLRVDNDAVRAHLGPLPWPSLRIPIDRVASATVEDIEPLRWGGWGYRLSTRGTALLVRRGPGLVIARRGASDVAVSVDDPQGAADLVNALLARSSGTARS